MYIYIYIYIVTNNPAKNSVVNQKININKYCFNTVNIKFDFSK